VAGKRAGVIWVDMTGGTEGPVKIMEKLADRGVGTIVGMHMGPELRSAAEEHNIHVVVAGHMSSGLSGHQPLPRCPGEERGRGHSHIGLIRVRRDEGGAVTSTGPGTLPQ